MTPEEITLNVAPKDGKSTRLVEATWGSGFHRDRLNTDNAESRRRFFGIVAERTGILRAELVRVHDIALIRLADEIDAKAEEAARLEAEKQTASAQPRSREELLAAMPDAIKAEALALLESPTLLQTVLEDIGRLGVAGERELGQPSTWSVCPAFCTTHWLLSFKGQVRREKAMWCLGWPACSRPKRF